MSKLICVGLLAITCGCVSSEAPEKLQSWNNERADRLVEVMGKPAETTTAANGTKTLTYQFEEKVPRVVPSHRSGSETVVSDYANCTVEFTVDASNRVARSGIGDASERCGELIPENPNKAMAH